MRSCILMTPVKEPWLTTVILVSDVEASTTCAYLCRVKLSSAHVVSLKILLENKVWCAFSSRIGSILSTSCWKINRSLSNRKWMSTVVDDVDSWREAWYVIVSSVATSRCPVVDTVVLDHRCRTWLLFVNVVRRHTVRVTYGVPIHRPTRRRPRHSSIALSMVWSMPCQTCRKRCFSSQHLFR